MTNNGSVLVTYMPQDKEWKNYEEMDFLMAFSLTPYQKKEVVGVLYIHAATYADNVEHMVILFIMHRR